MDLIDRAGWFVAAMLGIGVGIVVVCLVAPVVRERKRKKSQRMTAQEKWERKWRGKYWVEDLYFPGGIRWIREEKKKMIQVNVIRPQETRFEVVYDETQYGSAGMGVAVNVRRSLKLTEAEAADLHERLGRGLQKTLTVTPAGEVARLHREVRRIIGHHMTDSHPSDRECVAWMKAELRKVLGGCE